MRPADVAAEETLRFLTRVLPPPPARVLEVGRGHGGGRRPPPPPRLRGHPARQRAGGRGARPRGWGAGPHGRLPPARRRRALRRRSFLPLPPPHSPARRGRGARPRPPPAGRPARLRGVRGRASRPPDRRLALRDPLSPRGRRRPLPGGGGALAGGPARALARRARPRRRRPAAHGRGAARGGGDALRPDGGDRGPLPLPVRRGGAGEESDRGSVLARRVLEAEMRRLAEGSLAPLGLRMVARRH